MKRMLIILTAICISWPLIGCSGMPVKKTDTMEKPGQPELWQQVEKVADLAAMDKLFTELWNDNDEFRGMINHGRNDNNDPRRLAAAYCLVTADPTKPWRRQLATHLYQDGLDHLPPEKLANDHQRALFAAALARDGRLPAPSAAVRPADQAPKQVRRPPAITAAPAPPRPATTAGKKEKGRRLFFEIQVIRARLKKGETSRELAAFAESMRDTLPFSSYVLTGKKSLLLAVGETGELFLTPGRRLLVTPRKQKRGKAVVQTVIVKDHEEMFKTLVETGNGGTVTIAGPQDAYGQLFMQITTRLAGK